MPSGNKTYAIVDPVTGLYNICHFAYSYEPPDPEPTPNPEGDYREIHLSEEVLDGLTVEEFEAQKRPILEGSPPEVTGWAFKIDDPGLEVDQDPYDDGSNIVTVTITGDPQLADLSYEAQFSRAVSMNLSNGEGILDDQGDGSFKFKVIGQGDLRLTLRPRNHNMFQDATLDINVLPAPFA